MWGWGIMMRMEKRLETYQYLADKENGLSRELGVRYPILQAIFSCKNHQKNWVCCI